MLLKKIKLNNIRSYENHEVEFNPGSTLLSGDIGSGKTSILLAIEFAFFGLQPGQRGASLLRNGETSGGVTMEFFVEGNDVIIERTLKKGKTISQDYCAITINEEKEEISVTELKSRVLELLSYPKEFSKKQNLLYKFTVYTPQEEMKQIILEDPGTRINTLRHVFGIDKYKKVLENVAILGSKLREEKRIKQALTINLEQEKLEIVSNEIELETMKVDLVSLEGEFIKKIEERKKREEEKKEISFKIEEKQRLSQEVEKTKILLSTKNDSIFSNERLMEQIEMDMEKLNAFKLDESKIISLDQEITIIKERKKELSEKNLNLTSTITSLKIKNQDNEAVKNKIKQIDLCPTCLQDVDSVYKSNVVNKFDSDTSGNINKINSLILEKKQVLEEITKLEIDISLKEKELGEIKILRIKLQGLEEKKIRLEQITNSNDALKKDMALLERHLESLKHSKFELSKYDGIYESKQSELIFAREQERKAEIKVAELKKEIELFKRQIISLHEKIEKTKNLKLELDYITELENWLSKNFVPLVARVEKNVMIKLKVEFSTLFSEWFGMLVSDQFNVYLRDDFTPVIELQDYEIDYAYLSGGERTAIALAYRLALNQVINSIMSKIKTRNLVILDEPTDGFSEQQLDKMREVLEQLKVGQLIIVSHEQKIEGFVENVIKLKKENGVSEKKEIV
ncbi:AAA family ATPase [archaeon]|mgnify:FL=1|jgi:DNA repair protein SbcC/Rad50|nr:AAA family ATPase [archaeon]